MLGEPRAQPWGAPQVHRSRSPVRAGAVLGRTARVRRVSAQVPDPVPASVTVFSPRNVTALEL